MNLKNSKMLINRLSKIFQPINVIPNVEKVNSDITSKSQRLMLDLGVIRQASHGCFHFLPLGLRSLEKLVKIIDEEMHKINAQKILLPSLTNTQLWKKSGRFESEAGELFTLKDRNFHSYILSPTHEESISDLLASVAPLSYRNLPIRLYQISSKYRDEMKPRFGLMRSRQFVMKDLYSFDADESSARETYDAVCESYCNVFKKIGVDFVRVLGANGNMGGSISHEFHYLADIGEDEILTCTSCGHKNNTHLYGRESCSNCKSTGKLEISSGIEVGHTFLLGDRYSKPLNATYSTKNSKTEFLQMGSYGLGLSRILAAAIEVLSTPQEMRWPDALAPFTVLIIPPKAGSKEEESTAHLTESLYSTFESLPGLKNEVLVDDHTSSTIGRRYLEGRRFGYPYIIVIGKKATENPPVFEINDLKKNVQLFLNETALVSYLKQRVCL